MTFKPLKRVFLHVALPALMLSLSACSILPKADPQVRYSLPSTAQTFNVTQVPHTLFVATPMSNRLVNSNKILVEPTGAEIQVYKGALWADNAPVLVREQIVQALNNAHLFQATTQVNNLNTPYALESYLRMFQVKYIAQQPVVMIQLDMQLVNRKNNDIIGTQAFNIKLPSPETDINTIVDTFGIATDKLTVDVVQWLDQKMQQIKP